MKYNFIDGLILPAEYETKMADERLRKIIYYDEDFKALDKGKILPEHFANHCSPCYGRPPDLKYQTRYRELASDDKTIYNRRFFDTISNLR